MTTSAGIARTPYSVTVHPRVCRCELPARELGRARTLSRAVTLVEGYWAAYVGFYGDQTYMLRFQVVDLRDGAVMWRDGRQLIEERESGTAKLI